MGVAEDFDRMGVVELSFAVGCVVCVRGDAVEWLVVFAVVLVVELLVALCSLP